jgi:hypothetical protein
MKLAALFFVSIIMLTGCVKEVTVVQKSRITLLTEYPWKLVAEFQRIGALPAWGANSYFPADCEADNLYRFTPEGIYHITEGSSKCIITHPDTIAVAQWTWLQNNHILIDAVSHTIERLDDNNLVMVFPRTLGGRQIQVRWEFVH